MPIGTATGISLWLEPEGPSRARFATLIRRLAVELGTPAFEPHVTLLGGLPLRESEVVERVARLAARLAPLEVRLTRAGVGSDYFRFLYFEAAMSRELVAAHAAARGAFELADARYEPHLSLAYAAPAGHSPEKLLQRVQGRRWGRFRATSLTVVRTVGTPAEWRVLKRLPLAGSAP
jgi:2'-5' RNA ligase